MSRRSQRSLHSLVAKDEQREAAIFSWDNTVFTFYQNLKNWKENMRVRPMPDQLRVRLDIQFEVIRRSLEQPLDERRKEKILRQLEALSFMSTPLAVIFNVPEEYIVF
jgi:hypothetical protein